MAFKWLWKYNIELYYLNCKLYFKSFQNINFLKKSLFFFIFKRLHILIYFFHLTLYSGILNITFVGICIYYYKSILYTLLSSILIYFDFYKYCILTDPDHVSHIAS